jgi:2-oxoglutarate ferredoxin oxidoreductase subunit gamma
MPTDRWEVCLAGSGGQGIISAGIILAEAAVLAGLNAVQTQSYGPESRGGASRAEVVLSAGEIDYPKALSPEVLLALTAHACERYAGRIADDGLLIVDDQVEPVPVGPYRTIRAPIMRIAAGELRRPIVANIVALGVLAAVTQVVPAEVLERAVLARVPRGTEDLNRTALRRGYDAGRQAVEAGREDQAPAKDSSPTSTIGIP